MKNLIWITLVIGLFGCKAKKEFNPNSLENTSIDSMVIYYTQNKLDYFEEQLNDTNYTKLQLDSLSKLNYFLHGSSVDFYRSNFFSTILSDSVIIKDSTLINELKNIFYYRDKDEELQNPTACVPDYRDLIIFYSHGKRIGGIKICFTCGYILFSPFELDDFDVTENSFTELENYFNKNIHKINH